MDYNRQEFINGKTVLKAEMLDHIEDGISNNEKDNFLFTYGRDISSNLYKKEALRVNSSDLINALLTGEGYLRLSNKVPSLEDFYNGFTICYDIPFDFLNNENFEDKQVEYLEYIASFYEKIYDSLSAEIQLDLADLFPVKFPLIVEAPAAIAPAIAPLVVKTDLEEDRVSFLSLPSEGDGDVWTLIFVLEDVYEDGELFLEKGTYGNPFLFPFGISLYIDGFSFEEEEEPEEAPVIQTLENVITWNGITNGLITSTLKLEDDNFFYEAKFCKLSDTFPTLEQLQKGYAGVLETRVYSNGEYIEQSSSFNVTSEKFAAETEILEGGKAIFLGSVGLIVFENCDIYLEGSLGQLNPGFYGMYMKMKSNIETAEYWISSFNVQNFNSWKPSFISKAEENLDIVYASSKDNYIYKTSNTEDKNNRVTAEQLLNKQLLKGKLPLISFLPFEAFSPIGAVYQGGEIDEETGQIQAYYKLINPPTQQGGTFKYYYTAEYPEE